MQKWQYKILSFTDRHPAEDAEKLAAAGDEGWEAVAVWRTSDGAMVLLKRGFYEVPKIGGVKP